MAGEMQLALTLDTGRLDAVWDVLLKELGPQGVADILDKVGKRMGRSIVLRYPDATGAPLEQRYIWPDGRRSKFASPKAQRGFFARLRDGRIQVPYRRTKRLARSMTYTLTYPRRNSFGYETDVVVGVNESKSRYAVFVLGGRLSRGGRSQSSYFARRTHWKPLDIMMSEQYVRIVEVAERALKAMVPDGSV